MLNGCALPTGTLSKTLHVSQLQKVTSETKCSCVSANFSCAFLIPTKVSLNPIHRCLTYSLHRTTTVKDYHIEDLSLLHCCLVSSILSDIFVLQTLYLYEYRVKQVTIPIIKEYKNPFCSPLIIPSSKIVTS